MKFLREYFYGGIDWHDSYSNTTVMYHNGEICTKEEDYISAIADNIFKGMEKYFPITKEKFIEILEKVCTTKIKEQIPLYEEKENGKMEITSFECDNGTFYENEMIVYIDKDDYLTIEHSTWGGQAVFYYHYEEEDIPDNDIAYMVCESFHCPTKGVPVVERMYTDLFDNLKDAEEYRKELDQKIQNRGEDFYPHSESTLNIVKKELTNSDFYTLNMKANDLMKMKNMDITSDDFRVFVESHIKELES